MDLTRTCAWKGGQNYLCFADDMILYVEIPKDFMIKLLEVKGKFSDG